MKMMPRTVDRSLAKMISTKRIVTGSLCICAGIGLTIASVLHGGRPSAQLGLALLIFFAGGSWTMRDGLRLRKELNRTAQ